MNLFIEQSQYIPELSDTAGARVVVHDQGQMPFPNNEGYSVLPSRSTSFGIRRVSLKAAALTWLNGPLLTVLEVIGLILRI